MVSDEHIHEIICNIYDAVIDAQQWVNCLDLICEAMEARGIILFDLVQIPEIGEKLISSMMSSHYSAEAVDEYLTYFGKYETEDQLRFAKKSDRGEKIELVSIDEIYTTSELAQRPNAQFLNQRGVKFRAGAILNKDSWQIDRFSTQYADPKDALTHERQAIAGKLLPHLSKALRLARPFGIGDDGAMRISKFDELDIGVCILSPQGYPIYRNHEFRTIDEACGLFRLNNQGQLLPMDDQLKAYLNGYFDGIHAHGRFGAQPRKESLSQRIIDQNTTLFIEAGPIHQNSDFGSFPEDTQLLQILDINRVNFDKTNGLNRHFSLTNVENEISKLIIGGHSNQQIAEIRGRAVDTINSQVKNIFRKTYTTGRVELAQLSYALEKSMIVHE